MSRKIILWIAVVGFVVSLAGSAKADDIAELRKELENQYNALLKVQNKLMELETNQQQQGNAIQSMKSTGTMTIPETLAWIEKIKIYADFRYRYEYIDNEGSSSDRHRNRIRARVGIKGQINDEITYDLRLASGSSDSPTTTNQTLDGGFSSKDIWLDRAYIKYEPASVEGLSILLGKMGNPWFKPGGNGMIWDGDVNPEGVAAQYVTGLADDMDLFVNAGGMWVEESSSDVDVSLWGIQGGLKHDFDSFDLTWGGTYYKYGNIKDSVAIFDNTDGFGNTTYTSGADQRYMYDYELVELFGQVDAAINDTPVSVYGDYIVNTASGVSEDTGWLVGCLYNKAKAPGTWEIGYEYCDLESDATVAVFTDGDLFDGRTNGKGHRIKGAYALAKNTKLAASYYFADYEEDGDGKRDDDLDIFQVDLIVKF